MSKEYIAMMQVLAAVLSGALVLWVIAGGVT
jgi:hypothetical protein